MAFSCVEWAILAVIALVVAILLFRGFATILGAVLALGSSVAAGWFSYPYLVRIPIPVDPVISSVAVGLSVFLLIRRSASRLAWILVIGGVIFGIYLLWQRFGGGLS